MKRITLVALLTIMLSTAHAQKIHNKKYSFKVTSSQNIVTRESSNTYVQIDIHASWKLITLFKKDGSEEDYLITDTFGDYGTNTISYEITDDNKNRSYFTLTIDDRWEFSGRFKGDNNLTFYLREK